MALQFIYIHGIIITLEYRENRKDLFVVNSKIDLKKLTIIAVLGAAAYLAMLASQMFPPLVPMPPLKYDPKDVVILLGGFLYGPLAAAAISVIVSLIEMISVSTTGPIGLVMNIVSTCSFTCVAAFIYKFGPKKKTLTGAVIGLFAGVVSMVSVMMLWNYIITPIYVSATREGIAAAREMVSGMLIPVFLPFNLLKGGLNAALTMLIYKPLSTALVKLHLISKTGPANSQAGKINAGVIAASLGAAATVILLMLVFAGVI